MVISMINCKTSDSNQCDLHRQHPTSCVPRASGQHKPCTAAKDLHQDCSQQSSSVCFASTRAANRLCTLLDTADGLLFLGFTKQSNTGTALGWTNHTSLSCPPSPLSLTCFGCTGRICEMRTGTALLAQMNRRLHNAYVAVITGRTRV